MPATGDLFSVAATGVTAMMGAAMAAASRIVSRKQREDEAKADAACANEGDKKE